MDLKITSSANSQLSTICQTNNKNVRLVITSGGCQGFNKSWELSDIIEDDDVIFPCDTGALVIDTNSLELIAGSTIDFETKLGGSCFIVQIPHATSTCGCGNSFNI